MPAPLASSAIASGEAPRQGSLWQIAVLIMLIVFGPAMLAWVYSLLSQAH